jgi:hypothetical protein
VGAQYASTFHFVLPDRRNTLDKKESKRQLVAMLESGHSKTEIFKTLSGGEVKDPVLTLIGAGITLGMVFFVAYLKTLLFPDLGFLGSKKVKGHYVFSN